MKNPSTNDDHSGLIISTIVAGALAAGEGTWFYYGVGVWRKRTLTGLNMPLFISLTTAGSVRHYREKQLFPPLWSGQDREWL